MSQLLQYNYAAITETGECTGCVTTSYEVNHPQWIEVPVANSDYVGKFYNFDDGLFYYEPEYITVFDPEA